MGKTNIAKNLINETVFIDPASGKVLSTGTTPMATVRAFKEAPQPVLVDTKDLRLDKLESDISEIKELLTKALK